MDITQYIQTYQELIKKAVSNKILPSVAVAISCIETNNGNVLLDGNALYKIPAKGPGEVYDIVEQKVMQVDEINKNQRYYSTYKSLEDSINDWLNNVIMAKTKKGNSYKFGNIFGVKDYRKVANLLQQSGYGIPGPEIIEVIMSNNLFNLDNIVDPSTVMGLMYYVRKNSTDTEEFTLLSTSSKDEAIVVARENPGYKVYDKYGALVEDPTINNIGLGGPITSRKEEMIYTVKENTSAAPVYKTKNLEKAKKYATSAGNYRVYDSSNILIFDPLEKAKTDKPRGIDRSVLLVRGIAVSIENANVYNKPYNDNPIRTVTGTYYIYDEIVMNNKIKLSNVKNASSLTCCLGWVSIYDLRQK